MARYKLSTGLWTANENPNFDNDGDAWNYLRLVLPNKYATLYKEIDVEVPNNNEEHYVPTYNSKYGPRPIGYGPDNAELKEIGKPSKHTVWIPVLEGLTCDEYNVKNVEKHLAD